MILSSILFRCIGGAALGATPGVVITALAAPKVGVSVAVLGAFAGALLVVPGTSASRVARMLATMIVRRNIPLSDEAYAWVDDADSSPVEGSDFSNAFTLWLFATDVGHRRGWVVGLGLIVGLIAGTALAIHDVLAVFADQRGLMLPFEHSKDSVIVQGLLLAIAMSVWNATAVGAVTASAYGRPILIAVPFACFMAYMVTFAADTSRGGGPLVIVVMAATGAAAVAMIFAACGDEFHHESESFFPDDNCKAPDEQLR